MAFEKNILTRIILTHDEYNDLKGKTLKEGEVVLAKVGTTEANGKVSEPIWMMKVGTGNTVFESCPWLVAPAADVYEWAKKSSLDSADLPAIPGDKLGISLTVTGTGNAVTDASWDAETKTLTLTKGETFLKSEDFHDTTYSAGTKLDLDGTTFNHETTTRTDTSDTSSAEFGKTIEVIDSVTSDETGHITAVNKKTITLPTPEEISLPTVEDTAAEGQFVTEVDQNAGAISVTRKSVDVVYGDDGFIKLAIDGKPIGTGFDAADFVKDSYLSSAEYNDETNILTLTFIDNEDKLQPITVDLSDLVDVYSADEITLTKEGSTFKIKAGGVGTEQIADKAVTKDKLDDTVVASLNKADSAIQEHQDISGKADKVSGATSGNFAGLDANGNLTDSGKKAEDFATADHNHDDAYAPIDIDTGVMSVKAKDEGTPSSSYASGIKVDNTDTKNPKIEIDDTIVFVLDGGDASRLI